MLILSIGESYLCSVCVDLTVCSHVILPKEMAKTLPRGRTLAESEWRGAGIQQSRGWEHYACHRPEPHILLFRRPLGTDPVSGEVDPELEREAKQQYQQELIMNMQK
jgi:cyclin-dependent kinase regulatory subunit CKS1